jgi:hypothetical protein
VEQVAVSGVVDRHDSSADSTPDSAEKKKNTTEITEGRGSGENPIWIRASP